jgi:hypothetical protein
MITVGQGMKRYWSQVRGPATIPAHTTATIELRAPSGHFSVPLQKGAYLRLRAFTATPQTLSTRDLRPSQLGVRG